MMSTHWCEFVRSDQDKDSELRILIVGSLVLSSRKKPSYVYSTGLPSSPTLHDFSIMILRYSNDSFQRASRQKWEEWKKFRKNAGVAFILGIDTTIQRHANKILGRGSPNLEKAKGRLVKWTRGTRFYEALKSFKQVPWSVTVPRSEEHLVNIIGRNAAGDAIAFESISGNNSIVFLPDFEKEARDLLIPQLIESAEKWIAATASSGTMPAWADTLKLHSESKFLAEAEMISNKLRSLSRAKRILVDDGKSLSEECARILTDIFGPEGFTVNWREEEGGHDIEILGSSVSFVCEVRGSSGSIDVSIARQLMDHIQQFVPSTARVKGIVIGNAFRTTPLAERGDPFSNKCIDLAHTNNFCLISSTQLLSIYDDITRKTLQPHDLVSYLTGTVGVLPLPDPSWSK